MSSCFVKLFYALVLLLSNAAGSILSAEIKCIESEKQTLLNFKQSLSNDHGMLSTWRDGNNNTDCCEWRDIQCHNETGHIQLLDLHGDYRNAGSQYLEGSINLTSLIDLHNIQHLDLSNNFLLGSYIPEELIGSFTNLTYLNLSYALFGGGIPFELGHLTHLQYLDLSNNFYLYGELPYQLGNLTYLQYLDLSNNDLNGEIPYQLGNISQLRLVDCSLLDTDLQSLFYSVMNSLETLYLSGNKLQGKIPSFFGNMCRLQILDLSNNKLNGEISSFIESSSWCNQHIFQGLSLSYNQVTGVLPKSIGLLSELKYLDLEGNYLEGEVNESHLSNFSKLEYLGLSGNSLSLKVVPSWVPPFQLKYLELRSCKLGPSFPSWLQTQRSLTSLDISDNAINDSVPEWFWGKLQTMQTLNMSHNNLTGEIPNSSLKLLNRPSIFLDSNQIGSKVLKSQRILRNCHPSLGNRMNSASLACLMLSGKYFPRNTLLKHSQSTAIPLAVSMCEYPPPKLGLSNKHINSVCQPPLLRTSQHSEDLLEFTDTVVSYLRICISLKFHYVGAIISHYCDVVIAAMSDMRGNHLSGNLPIHLCYLKHIQLLDLSRNYMSGGIPTCLKNFTAMAERSINRSDTMRRVYWINSSYYEVPNQFNLGDYTFEITWMWKGVEQGFKDPELNLKSIDLSCNNLTGEIPKEMGYLLGLVSLNLARNKLSGEIPSEIGNLSSLDYLNLSRNHFTGRIPSSLSEIDGLGKLDLSHNSLSGSIATGRHFETYDASSFEGNVDLCGEQINKSCHGDGDRTTTVNPAEAAEKGEDSDFYEALYMSMGGGYCTGVWGLIGPILLWRPWRNAYLMFLNRFIGYIYVWLRTLW
uniref:LRR receptor-like serine/threonine-protein kinase FLS2 n=1 Tax=Cajanus cajan TaxID=3821 RepID=A0A151QQ88_CAJCA|nr:LRR receptor-like serine/threonine-protein kinase FLS2 [Cajanus cajan]